MEGDRYYFIGRNKRTGKMHTMLVQRPSRAVAITLLQKVVVVLLASYRSYSDHPPTRGGVARGIALLWMGPKGSSRVPPSKSSSSRHAGGANRGLRVGFLRAHMSASRRKKESP
ncbi:hypothetical protein E2562_037012 [Oryza meyeriana var. granulata]|uniref:Uncharacterized protein n=1 Tax=Oryza meyeriana var. granulata TaxID=110450 RepID=A0A6G1CZ48_9ORYZ|nr:hypothetical protein E2562_037012 [Oryza meyeriana var. granulata]